MVVLTKADLAGGRGPDVPRASAAAGIAHRMATTPTPWGFKGQGILQSAELHVRHMTGVDHTDSMCQR